MGVVEVISKVMKAVSFLSFRAATRNPNNSSLVYDYAGICIPTRESRNEKTLRRAQGERRLF